MTVGLRIDVDTWRGTRDGVPRLCRMLHERGLRGTFFFSCGPDNMGRHLWRLLSPQFFVKMLRSNAPGLYGWDILLRGTLWPGPVIGRGQKSVLRDCAHDGHEIGVHAWDHHAWQAHIERVSQPIIADWTRRAIELLSDATGAPPICAASPGWRTTESVLRSREEFSFKFNSDCRGTSVFRPVVDGKTLQEPQIPTTLPTYDEVIGKEGITRENYNDFILAQLRPDALNVLTIHAEVEGIVCANLFAEFLDKACAMGINFVPLSELLSVDEIPPGRIVQQTIPGREGWVAVQELV